MRHPGPSPQVRTLYRARLALLRGSRWRRADAAARARELAASALEVAALEVRARRDERVRAAVERAVRRLGLVAELEDER